MRLLYLSTNFNSIALRYFFIFLGALLMLSCENSESDIQALNRRSVQKDEARKVESFLSQGGQVKARLITPVMLRVNADTPYVEFPQSLHVDFYNDSKIVETRLDSKYGKYYEKLNKVYLRDSVVVVSIKGDTLLCEDLWWDQNKEIFYTDLPVLLKSPAQYIPAKDGLEATQDFKKITFKTVHDSRLVTEEGTLP